MLNGNIPAGQQIFILHKQDSENGITALSILLFSNIWCLIKTEYFFIIINQPFSSYKLHYIESQHLFL